ncbi:MAG: hypothetical protein AAFP86_01750, partial [Planctomycetota bacterium]
MFRTGTITSSSTSSSAAFVPRRPEAGFELPRRRRAGARVDARFRAGALLGFGDFFLAGAFFL